MIEGRGCQAACPSGLTVISALSNIHTLKTDCVNQTRNNETYIMRPTHVGNDSADCSRKQHCINTNSLRNFRPLGETENEGEGRDLKTYFPLGAFVPFLIVLISV